MGNIKNKIITTLLAGSMLLKSVFPTDFYSISNNSPYTYGYNTSIVNELAPNFLTTNMSNYWFTPESIITMMV